MKSTKATNKIVSLLLVMAMLTSGFCIPHVFFLFHPHKQSHFLRSEERRVGKECN